VSHSCLISRGIALHSQSLFYHNKHVHGRTACEHYSEIKAVNIGRRGKFKVVASEYKLNEAPRRGRNDFRGDQWSKVVQAPWHMKDDNIIQHFPIASP
jgi:hypothetical protein